MLSALWTDARDFVKGDGLSKEVLRWPEVPWAARIGELVFRMVVKLLKRLGPVVVVTRKKKQQQPKQLGNVKGQLRNIRNVSQGVGCVSLERSEVNQEEGLLSHSVGRAHSGEPSAALLCIGVCAACARLPSVMHIAGFKVVAADSLLQAAPPMHQCGPG